ncbi:hypothetical protein [Natrinema versiforme]|uniref:Uncharacterized protein n=1 Tax=Natrinema versiforme JCM 10478 TaxID=1227496 RepID=L9XS22_9EURY|nr:hypothetical protein [Natrinema versiforme]ELY64545.1 hypothetical protein C489_17369 [Natrinema versiforme JCM 10478]
MRYVTAAQFEPEERVGSTAAIVAMGLGLSIAGIVQTLAAPAAQPLVAVELFLSLLVPTGLATGGYWLADRNVSSTDRWRAVTQVSVGIVLACAFALWLTGYVTLEGSVIRDPLGLTTTLAGVGGATGFVSAVRELPDESIGSSGSPGAAGAELPAPVAPVAPSDAAATVGTSSESTTSTVVQSAALESPIDGPPIPELPTTTAAARTAPSADSGTTSTREPRTATPLWADVDPRGRTGAPARPVGPSERTAIEGTVPDALEPSVRDASADAVGSHDPLESPTPARDPGVEAVAAVPSTAETVLGVLQRERARIALAVLYHEWDGAERSVEALARAVSYHVDGSADAVAIGLRHATLPELAEIRAVDWNPRTGRVSASDHAVFEEGVREAAVLLESFEPGTR